MKYAILGDIHANLEALTAVLEDARRRGASRFACTGDLVGYHANPHECIEIIRALNCPVVMGNHDEEAADPGSTGRMNPFARRAIEWTRSRLTGGDLAWLRSQPLTASGPGFTLVHATLDCPSGWQYIFNRFDASGHFHRQTAPLCFCGHTHIAGGFVSERGIIRALDVSAPVRLRPGCRYLINAGSVGMPRDHDRRAAYALYDADASEVTICRVPFDYQLTREKSRSGPMRDSVELLMPGL